MFFALRSHGALPPCHPDAPGGRPTAAKREEILTAFAVLGGPISSMQPQMEAAISAAVVLSTALPDVLLLASLHGHDGRLSVSVEPEPEGQ